MMISEDLDRLKMPKLRHGLNELEYEKLDQGYLEWGLPKKMKT